MKHLLIAFEANLKLNRSKCKWFAENIQLLGHKITNDGVAMNPEKVDAMNPEKIEAMRSLQKPKTVKDVQRFLGMSGYYRKYIQGYAKILEPLTNLTRKKCTFSFQ